LELAEHGCAEGIDDELVDAPERRSAACGEQVLRGKIGTMPERMAGTVAGHDGPNVSQ
jgi:hypothetical protein